MVTEPARTVLQPGSSSAARLQRGLSYIEVLVATVLVVVALVPAMDALRGGVTGSQVHQTETEKAQRLQSKMEEVLAKPFGSLYAQTYPPTPSAELNQSTVTNTVLSDPAGAAGRRLVVLYRYDGTARTDADSGLLRIKVAFEGGGASLETLKGRW